MTALRYHPVAHISVLPALPLWTDQVDAFRRSPCWRENKIYFEHMLHWAGVWGDSVCFPLPRGSHCTCTKTLRGTAKPGNHDLPLDTLGGKHATQRQGAEDRREQATGPHAWPLISLNDTDRSAKEMDLFYCWLSDRADPETSGQAAWEYMPPEWSQVPESLTLQSASQTEACHFAPIVFIGTF